MFASLARRPDVTMTWTSERHDEKERGRGDRVGLSNGDGSVWGGRVSWVRWGGQWLGKRKRECRAALFVLFCFVLLRGDGVRMIYYTEVPIIFLVILFIYLLVFLVICVGVFGVMPPPFSWVLLERVRRITDN